MMSTIYHLAPAARWHSWPANQPYLPAEYDADGFIHCTAGDELMLQVANAYYHDTPGEFVLLVIDPARLSAPLVWEAPAGPRLATEFPHIYGPINPDAIVVVRAVLRDADGTFRAFA